MKIVFRILAILLAAVVVVGVTYTVGRTDWATTLAQTSLSHGSPGDGLGHPQGRGGPAAEFQRPAERSGSTQDPTMPGGLQHRGEGRRAAPFSLASLLTFAHTLIPMALVITIVTLGAKGIAALRRPAAPAAE